MFITIFRPPLSHIAPYSHFNPLMAMWKKKSSYLKHFIPLFPTMPLWMLFKKSIYSSWCELWIFYNFYFIYFFSFLSLYNIRNHLREFIGEDGLWPTCYTLIFKSEMQKKKSHIYVAFERFPHDAFYVARSFPSHIKRKKVYKLAWDLVLRVCESKSSWTNIDFSLASSILRV